MNRFFLLLLGCMVFTLPNFFSEDEVENVASVTQAAVVDLNPTAGNFVTGQIVFTQQADGVLVTANMEHLTPGEHGFHIHEVGDCDAPDGSSAGAHYNPHQHSHGSRESDQRHMGDLGNIIADADGKAHLEYLDSTLQLNGADSIIGKSVIVHAQVDDFTTQPTGNSGARVACGVIQAVESQSQAQ